MVVYTSTQGHSCIQKAVEILGFGSDYLRRIPVDADFRMDVAALAQQIDRRSPQRPASGRRRRQRRHGQHRRDRSARARSPISARPRISGCTSTRAYGGVADPRRRDAAALCRDRSRRQPRHRSAQVALHSGRVRLRDRARRAGHARHLQPRAAVPARRHGAALVQRVHHPADAGIPRAQAVDGAAAGRARRLRPADRRRHRAGARAARAARRARRLRARRRRAAEHHLLPLRAAVGARRRRAQPRASPNASSAMAPPSSPPPSSTAAPCSAPASSTSGRRKPISTR